MAVFTPVTAPELSEFLARYSVGELAQMQEIASGIENTNYFVSTARARLVLTLFERLREHEVRFYLNFMAHLANHGIPAPRPIADLDNKYHSVLKGKPATLVTRLEGASEVHPTAAHCAQVGVMLAEMHLAAATFAERLPNPRGPHWWAITAPRVLPFLDNAQAALLNHELAFHACLDTSSLPRAVVHADLFRDNVLWHGERIGGVIDFYFAGEDSLLFDIAVTANDWCGRPDASLDPERLGALARAYESKRALSAAERDAWPAALRAAALRFWLSRLDDFHLPRPGHLINAHNPAQFRRILEQRVRHAEAWPNG